MSDSSQLVLSNVLWLVVCLSLLGAFALFLRWLRTRVYKQHVFAKGGWLKKVTNWIENHVEKFFIGFLILGTLAIMALVIWFLGAESTTAVLLAMGALVFVSFQLPRLLKPHVYLTPMISHDGRCFTANCAVRKLSLEANTEYLVAFQVTNLGINHIKRMVCWISLSSGLAPLVDIERYRDVDFAKKLTYQRGNNCVYFQPSENFQDITPAHHLLFPVFVRAGGASSKESITVEVACGTRWKSTSRTFHVDVTDAGK